LRALDGIPFANSLKIEMTPVGRRAGTVDYATTIFWYGDNKARPEKTTRSAVTSRQLSAAPTTDEQEMSD
jgi:hypothetical protein